MYGLLDIERHGQEVLKIIGFLVVQNSESRSRSTES
jgi:hypothetical protein